MRITVPLLILALIFTGCIAPMPRSHRDDLSRVIGIVNDSYSPRIRLIKLSAGRKNGTLRYDEFVISRYGRPLCRVQVNRVFNDMSTALVLPGSRALDRNGDPIKLRVGDPIEFVARGHIPKIALTPPSGDNTDGEIPELNGVIMAISEIKMDGQAELIMISLGRVNGVKREDRFVIYREDIYICQAIVEKVFEELAAARIIPESHARDEDGILLEIRKYDNASTKVY